MIKLQHNTATQYEELALWHFSSLYWQTFVLIAEFVPIIRVQKTSKRMVPVIRLGIPSPWLGTEYCLPPHPVFHTQGSEEWEKKIVLHIVALVRISPSLYGKDVELKRVSLKSHLEVIPDPFQIDLLQAVALKSPAICQDIVGNPSLLPVVLF